jgi:hypothetical protein
MSRRCNVAHDWPDEEKSWLAVSMRIAISPKKIIGKSAIVWSLKERARQDAELRAEQRRLCWSSACRRMPAETGHDEVVEDETGQLNRFLGHSA